MKISVYVPTHNRLALLVACVDSVMRQSYQDLELLVVDDGSTDGTAAFLEDAARKDSRIQFLRNERPRGAPASRNRAIQHATGEYVTGLDDDDEFTPDRLSALFDFWTICSKYQLKTSCIFTQDTFASDGIVTGVSTKRGTVEFPDLAYSNHIGNQIFAPKHVFCEAGLFDESLPAWQDLELFLRITKKFGTARLLDMPLYLRDMTPSLNRISSKFDRVRSAYKAVSSKHFPDDRKAQQLLMLQLFSAYYGIKPTLTDLREFSRLGMWPRGIATVIGRMAFPINK